MSSILNICSISINLFNGDGRVIIFTFDILFHFLVIHVQ